MGFSVGRATETPLTYRQEYCVSMADLFEGYRDTQVLAGSRSPFDEMFAGATSPRAPYGMDHEALVAVCRVYSLVKVLR